MNNIIQKVRKELREEAESGLKNDQRFFREKVLSYGVRTPVVRKLAKKYFKDIKHLGKEEIFALCEELFQSGYNEEATIAIQWASAFRDNFTQKDFNLFETWLTKYIDNWGKDDDFCLHILNPCIEKYPKLIAQVKAWAKSDNMWMRRASAVAFIGTNGGGYCVKEEYLQDVFDVATVLLHDSEDLVQKGYGWMLKASSVVSREEVFEFVIEHKSTMPRTALRYAIEKMPEDMRKKAMEK